MRYTPEFGKIIVPNPAVLDKGATMEFSIPSWRSQSDLESFRIPTFRFKCKRYSARAKEGIAKQAQRRPRNKSIAFECKVENSMRFQVCQRQTADGQIKDLNTAPSGLSRVRCAGSVDIESLRLRKE